MLPGKKKNNGNSPKSENNIRLHYADYPETPFNLAQTNAHTNTHKQRRASEYRFRI